MVQYRTSEIAINLAASARTMASMAGELTISERADALPTLFSDTDPSGWVSTSGTAFWAMLKREQNAFQMSSAGVYSGST